MKHVPPVRPPALPAGQSATPVLPPLPSHGSGTRIWLCRHAQVEAAQRTLAYGNLDVALSPEGEEQTRALWRSFAEEPIRHVRASDLYRARTLGEGIAEATGAELRMDPRLREIDRGEWTGIERSLFQERWLADAGAYHANTYAWKGHGGESDLDLFDRVYPAFEEARQTALGGTTFLAAHFNVVRVLLSRLCGVAPDESFHLPIQTAHATLIRDDADGWTVLARNVEDPREAPVS